MGQQCLMPMAMCGCPGFAPNYCAADLKCTSPTKDPDHCGDCMTQCAATSACNASACTDEPAAFGEIAGCGTLKLALDAGKLYALSTMTGDLGSIAVPAGGAPTPVATGLTGATAFAVDAMNAYVVAGMSIHRVALAGGAAAVVVTETTAIHDVAVSAGTLYYGTGNNVKSIAATATDGAPAAVQIALAASEGEPQAVAVSGTTLLYASASAMNVERCDTTMDCVAGAGTDVEERGAGHFKIGASQGGLIFGHRSMQTDGTKVYWVNNANIQGGVFAGTEPGTLGVGTKDGGAVTAYAVTPTAVYFADADQNFQKAALGDEMPTWLARGLGMVSSMVVDDTSVYLASGCKILKAPL
jgi:hypothetical protein